MRFNQLLSVFFIINWIIAYNTIKTSASKHFFTAFSGEKSQTSEVLVPIILFLAAIFLPGSCYAAKADYSSSKLTEKQFSNFSKRSTQFAFLPVCKFKKNQLAKNLCAQNILICSSSGPHNFDLPPHVSPVGFRLRPTSSLQPLSWCMWHQGKPDP